MPDRSDAVGALWTLGGIMPVAFASQIGQQFGQIWFYMAIFLGCAMLIGGPFAQTFALGYVARGMTGLICRMEPLFNEAQTVWVDYQGKVSERIESDPRTPNVPRFHTMIPTAKPRVNHPTYGPIEELHVFHNWAFDVRVNIRKGSINYLGFAVDGVSRDQLVLAERDTPFGDDYNKQPAWDLKRAGNDYRIEHGDMTLEEMQIPELRHMNRTEMEASVDD